jgi:hypothetical protein
LKQANAVAVVVVVVVVGFECFQKGGLVGWLVCLFDGFDDQPVFGRFFYILVCPNLCREDGDDILTRARSFFSGGNDSNAVSKGGVSLMANDGGGRRSRRRSGIVVVVVVVGKIISCTIFCCGS